jgi:NAD(P)-dependent dehydrogenase (short-subunit alcohol dehydrogenase family)
LHHGHSSEEAQRTSEIIKKLNRKVWILEADLNEPSQIQQMCETAFSIAPIYALINNAAIFKPVSFLESTLEDWNEHINLNLTAPFLLSQYFAKHGSKSIPGRIINILDWRALRPGKDHFPYTISKAALASMTRSLALTLAPNITVNAIALGAILPPENEPINQNILKNVPMQRWATLDELENLVTFLLDGPIYITGEIIHLDGGRHLV